MQSAAVFFDRDNTLNVDPGYLGEPEKVQLFEGVEEGIYKLKNEFNFRIIQSGFKIWLSKAIKAKYYVRSGFEKLWKQYYQYGYWKVYVNKKHNTITTWRQLVPAAFVSGLFIGLFFSLLFRVSIFEFRAFLITTVHTDE